MGNEVTALDQTDFLPAVETLVQAFAHDPVAEYLFPNPAKRPAGMAHIFQMGLRYATAYGRIDVIQPTLAVAVWISPQYTAPSIWRMVRAGMLATPFVVGWSATRRMLKFEHFIQSYQRRSLAVSHWYLFCIGVRRDQQGCGRGAALIRHGLKRAQASGLPCYLETANNRNLPFYDKQGFRVVSQQHLPGKGPGCWSLVAENDQLTLVPG